MVVSPQARAPGQYAWVMLSLLLCSAPTPGTRPVTQCLFPTRFILADTDRLHKKITEMSERIRQLEDALAILQSSTTRETHPLLRPDLLSIKSGLELHSAINQGLVAPLSDQEADEASQQIDAFGTLAVRDDGAATFYGRSAGSEVGNHCLCFLLEYLTHTHTPVFRACFW